MKIRQLKSIALLVLSAAFMLLPGCGGGGGGTSAEPPPPAADTYTITGKISHKDTALPINGVYVGLYEASFTIYEVDGLHGATVTPANTGKIVQTDSTGTFTFTGIPVGSYVMTPASTTYVFNPAESGAFTISGPGTATGTSTVYTYDKTTGGNSVIGTTIIYNSIISVTGNIVNVQNFLASLPGSSGFIP